MVQWHGPRHLFDEIATYPPELVWGVSFVIKVIVPV